MKLFKLISVLCYALLLQGVFFIAAHEATAKSVAWDDNVIMPYYDYYLDTRIVYSATMRNADTGSVISESTSVPVGTRVRIQNDGFSNSNIDWYPEGSEGPYLYPNFGIVNEGQVRQGQFSSNLNTPTGICVEANVALESSQNAICIGHSYTGSGGPGDGGGYCQGSNPYYHYSPIKVQTPSYSVSKSGGTANVSCSGDICTVTSAGTLQLRATYSATTLRTFYYRTNDDANHKQNPLNIVFKAPPLGHTHIPSGSKR